MYPIFVSVWWMGLELISITGGSLTRASSLTGCVVSCHAGGLMSAIINLTQTTSGSYLLLSQPRYFLEEIWLFGKDEAFERVIELAEYARKRDQSDRRLLCLFRN